MNEQSYRVLVVLRELENSAQWLKAIGSLAVEDIEITLRGVISVPIEVSLSEATKNAQVWRDTLLNFAKPAFFFNDDIRVLVDYEPYTRIVEEVNTLKPDLVILQWSFDEQSLELSDWLLQSVSSDLVLLDGIVAKDDTPVLLSLRGAPNMTLGMFVAKALSYPAPVTVLHGASRTHSVPNLMTILEDDPQVGRVITDMYDIRSGILREVRSHKAIVLGATYDRANYANSHLSPMVTEIRKHTQQPIAVVRSYQPDHFLEPMPMLQQQGENHSSVDRWFAENTFDSSEFANLEHLLELKQQQGLTISLGLPALNEAKTVGNVIQTLKRALMDDIPLVDEMVLIDSNSTDRTVDIARTFGIPVVQHSELVAEMGTIRGKGEALWKSLSVLQGDIITWVDTDITNMHPRFVYGLIGPLLKYPHLQYVKGYYQRPILAGNRMQESGGGRVTELMARPLLNMFYPELAGMVQPLSGEYAGRREALMSVPFFSGYGVETGLLIDLLDKYGLDAIAQTNLEVRVHHNQSLTDLSKMAFAILQVFMARLQQRHNLDLLDKANRTMRLIMQDSERLALDGQEIGDVERPPMMSVLRDPVTIPWR